MWLLGDFRGTFHFQEREGSLETGQRCHSCSPISHIGPSLQVELADFGEGYIPIAEKIRNGRCCRSEKVAMSKVGIEH